MASLSFPHLGETPRPQIDLDTHIVVDHAVVDLADRRFMRVLDAPVQVHLLASLIAQAESWLDEQVAAARQAGTPWSEIGRLLGLTATAARQRYSPGTKTTARRAQLADRRRVTTTRTPLAD